MKVVSIEEASKVCEEWKEMLKTERHHDHEIVDVDGVLRWKENKDVRDLVGGKGPLDLNSLWEFFYAMGLNKNSEFIRDVYRNMGYSLSGFWELFYWEMNNEDAADYNPMQEYRDKKIDDILN
jgi:hypothetical protein